MSEISFFYSPVGDNYYFTDIKTPPWFTNDRDEILLIEPTITNIDLKWYSTKIKIMPFKILVAAQEARVCY